MLGTIISALTSGTMMSMGRYLLVLFPFFILLASVKNKLFQVYKDELKKAYKCGLKQIIGKYSSFDSSYPRQKDFKKLPPKVVLDEEIKGIDVMEIERAVTCLLDNYIYASSGMGCIGPVIMLNKKDKEKAIEILKKEKIL